MHFRLLCILVLFSTCVRAQISAPYAPFRPMVSYYYSNPFMEEGASSPGVSEVLGFAWTAYGDFPHYELPMIAAPAEGGQVQLLPHFLAHESSHVTEESFSLVSPEARSFELTVNFGAPVGEEWLGNIYRGRVDSIVEMSFLGLTDSVKFISFVDQETDEQFPSLLLSKQYGMISGPYLNDLRLTDRPLELLGFSMETNWGAWNTTSAGVDFLEPFEMAISTLDARYYQEKRTEEVHNGVAGTRVTQRTWRGGDPGCDPVVDATFNPYSIREISYFAPADGGAPTDTIVLPSYQHWLSMPFYPQSSDDDWRVLPLGTVTLDAAGNMRTILPVQDDCYGIGIQLGAVLTPQGSPDLYTVDETTTGPAVYLTSMLPTLEEDEEDGGVWRLIGVEAGNTTCGTTWNFDRLYTSLSSFPDDERVTLSPNPAVGQTMLTVPFDLGSVWLEVYGIGGNLIHKTATTGGDRWLTVSSMPAGTYTVVVSGREGPIARRRLVVR